MRECAASDGTMALTELSEVSARIKELRGRTDLTQYEVAYKLKVPPRTYQSWENGEVETSRANYAKLGKLFGVTANWILFGQDEEPPMPSETQGGDQVAVLSEIAAAEERAEARHAEVLAQVAELRSLLEPAKTQGRRGQRRRASGQ